MEPVTEITVLLVKAIGKMSAFHSDSQVLLQDNTQPSAKEQNYA